AAGGGQHRVELCRIELCLIGLGRRAGQAGRAGDLRDTRPGRQFALQPGQGRGLPGHARADDQDLGGGQDAGRAPRPPAGAPSRLVTPWRRSQRGTGRNSRPPKMAMSAGPRVIDTAIAVRTVSARPGPNALRSFVLATTREAAVAATMTPAVRMIGANSAVAS